MKTTSILALAAVAALATSPAIAREAAKPPAKLSMAQARAIALKKAPGRVMSGEYEKEAGAWRYTFDVRQGGRIHEIGVDPNSGRIVEDKFEPLNSKD